MTWVSINEAPRDGRLCVVNDASGDYERMIAQWSVENVDTGPRAGWWDDGFWIHPQPTLYHPIDPPPVRL